MSENLFPNLDLCSDEHREDPWGSRFGEGWYGHAGVWPLRYVGDPSKSDRAFRGCLKNCFGGHGLAHLRPPPGRARRPATLDIALLS
jgi:hypothetical protein